MKLKKGYSLVWGEPEGHGFCGDGTTVPVSLVRDGQIVAKFVTCPCGRGCGNKDVVLCDALGSHDLEPEIEEVRADALGVSQPTFGATPSG